MTTVSKVDICIVGGGMVGSCAAIALSRLGYKVTLIEYQQPSAYDSSQSPDLRVSALNHFSLAQLTELNVWSHITSMRYRDYDQLDVWESEKQLTSFDAVTLNKKKLGAFVENRIIQLAALKEIEKHHCRNINVMFDKCVIDVNVTAGFVKLDDGSTIQAEIIVGADGANSIVRRSAGIGTTGWDYSQQANLISVELSESFKDCTWQRFTDTGPIAFLPMHERNASLVWYADNHQSGLIQKATNADLQDMIRAHFPTRLAAFKVLDKSGFALTRMHVNQYFKQKAVLIGDAAHTINPLAGQGVNLGFKDMAALCEGIKRHGIKEKQELAFGYYCKQRRRHNLLMMSAMDGIYTVFKNPSKPVRLLRNIGLNIAHNSGPLKRYALKYATGLI